MSRADHTLRAGPSRRPPAGPRAPTRERGVIRYEALLDIVEALLKAHGTEAVSLAMVAEQAALAPASVYHFFPNIQAAFVALSRRHQARMADLSRLPVPAACLESWRSLLAWDVKCVADYYNREPQCMKLILGGFGELEIRRLSQENNVRIARGIYSRYQRAFEMPFLEDAETLFLIAVEIIDAVFSVAYMRHEHVPPAFEREAVRAAVAYARSYLPEYTPLRQHLRAAIDAGQPIQLFQPPSALPAAP